MKAYKCDRCGEFYDKEATSIQSGNYYVLKNPHNASSKLDLCPKCQREINECMDIYKED